MVMSSGSSEGETKLPTYENMYACLLVPRPYMLVSEGTLNLYVINPSMYVCTSVFIGVLIVYECTTLYASVRP